MPSAKMRCPPCLTMREGMRVSVREIVAISPSRIIEVSPGRAIRRSSRTASLRSQRDVDPQPMGTRLHHGSGEKARDAVDRLDNAGRTARPAGAIGRNQSRRKPAPRGRPRRCTLATCSTRLISVSSSRAASRRVAMWYPSGMTQPYSSPYTSVKSSSTHGGMGVGRQAHRRLGYAPAQFIP